MRKEVSTIGTEFSAIDVSKKMAEDNVNYLVALEKGYPKGIVTEKDLVQKVLAKGTDPRTTKVSSFMSSPLVTVDPDASIEEAVRIMAKHKLRKLPVVKGEILYGIFTARDLIQHYDELEKKVVEDITRYIMW